MTDHPDSISAEEDGLSRRKMFQAMAAGAVASAAIAARALAQTVPATSVIASADYVRDPNRWGTPAIAALFPGFAHVEMKTSGAIIRLRHGGSGPPLLLMHGNPLSHVSWYKIAAQLSQRYHVVLPDLRGYGDSSLPDPGPGHINYSFPAMALAMLEVMERLGFAPYFAAAPGRGCPTAHRPCPG